MADTTWATLVEILGVPPTTAPDDVLSLVRRLAADRTPDQEQLLWDAVPPEIPRAELDRRITAAMRALHYAPCGHTATAFLILRDGVRPPERSRCVPKPMCHCTGPEHVLTCPDQREAPRG